MPKEFLFINFFRATAAVWVLAAHCMIWGGWYELPLPSAKIAVDLFMIISGYLMMANTYAKSKLEPLNNRKNCLRFWLRRLFRLAPAYYLSLALAIILSADFLLGYQSLQKLNPAFWPAGGLYDPTKIEYSLTNILLHLSFLFGLHPSYSFSTFLPDWSLSLEMQFYFVFPALFLLMQKYGFNRTSLFIGLPALIIGFIISKLFHYLEPSLLVMKINYFLAGILLFDFLIKKTNLISRITNGLCAIFLVSLDFRYGRELVVLPFLLFSMFLFGWLELENRTPAWFSILFASRFTRFASNTSYGVYLFHGFFISASGLIISEQPQLRALTPAYRTMAIFAFVGFFSYITAYLVYKIIELPGIRFGKKIIERLLPLTHYTQNFHIINNTTIQTK